MNYTVLVLGVWCIIQVIIAIWGLGLLNNKCNNLSLYTRLRTLLVMSAVTATVFFANLMCNIVCYEDHEETSIWVAIFTLISAIIVIVMEVQIRSDIDDCANNTDTYKMVLLYAGILPSIFPLLYGCWMIWDWFKNMKERREIKSREKTAGRELIRQQKEKAREEELMRRTAAAEEKERQAELIRKERQLKAEAQTAKLQAQAEERARQAVVAREKAEKERKARQDAVRKARGEYTADERIAMAKEKRQKEAVAAAERKVTELEREVLEPGLSDADVATIGIRLEKAQRELERVKTGEKQQVSGWDSMFGRS